MKNRVLLIKTQFLANYFCNTQTPLRVFGNYISLIDQKITSDRCIISEFRL